MNDNIYYQSWEEWKHAALAQGGGEAESVNSASGPMGGLNRRQFLKLMGASIALAGAAGCRWPEANIVPFNGRPEGYVPGMAVQYATSMEMGGVAAGLLATSYDGRPIKIEGNPRHPTNQGATNAFQQASILGLYDPDRSQWVVKRERESAGNAETPKRRNAKTQSSALSTQSSSSLNPRLQWDDFADQTQDLFARLRGQKGEGLYFLSEAASSPTVERLRKRLAEVCPKHQWLEYEPISWDNEREGTRLVLGRPCRVDYCLDQADTIVSLDADFLWAHPAGVKYARDFAARRRADDGRMNRLYAFESLLSLTGSMADHRLPLRSALVLNIALAMANPMGLGEGLDIEFSMLVNSERFKAGLPELPKWFQEMMRELQTNRGRSAILAGPRQPAVVHALACVMNAALGNIGQTVLYRPDLYPDRPTHAHAVVQLEEALEAGKVDTLVVLGGNPFYNAADELGFDNIWAKPPNTIHLGLYYDETGCHCTWHVPQAHYLESWADSRAWDGTISLTQPLIEPLYKGRTAAEMLAFILGEPAKARDLVRQTLQERHGGLDFESYWQAVLHDGVVPDTAIAPIAPRPRHKPLADALAKYSLGGKLDPSKDEFELVLCPSASTYDGRFANNGWLQELPDNLTKISWDNALLISPAAAERLKLTSGDVVRVFSGTGVSPVISPTSPDREGGGPENAETPKRRNVETQSSVFSPQSSLSLPVFILPGQAEDSLTIAVGYGRTACGQVGNRVGVDVYPLRGPGGSLIVPKVHLEKTDQKYKLAITLLSHPSGTLAERETKARVKELIREGSLKEYLADPAFAQSAEEKRLETQPQLFAAHPYDGYKWGMMIDLSACIGCSACETACMAENNIPVVGKDEVARGRIMHWLRIDRYFTGAPQQPAVAFQPVPCMQCENAPCETVCPVGATMHDSEGLNAMAYNRCIGTRYCSNNCPFKVRRFNWFWNQKNLDGTPLGDVQKMVYNPSVTLRSRGVMEKCTYCVQRIAKAKIEAKNKAVSELGARQLAGELPQDAGLPEKIAIADGTIVPACAQACPAQAITFGDLNDPESKVAKLAKSPRHYGLLAELNVRVRTKYLAKLRNKGETEF